MNNKIRIEIAVVIIGITLVYNQTLELMSRVFQVKRIQAMMKKHLLELNMTK